MEPISGEPSGIEVPGYEFIQRIGHGGMGEVYLARQTSLGRLVAIKVLAFASESHRLENALRFRREAEIMAKINHPNVVSIYDFGEVCGRPYLVMEYFEAGDLRRMMSPGRPWPIGQTLALIAPVARALSCLHGHGILHRDLKPENILMADPSAPKVADFGIALQEDSNAPLTQAGCWRGTIGYVAPEQQYQLKVDERADQYSLAALSFELLTGERAVGRHKPASTLNPGLPAAADGVLDKALQEDPDDRYGTPLEFAEALEKALATPPRKPRGRLTVRGMALGLAMLLLIVLAGFTWQKTVHRRGAAAAVFSETTRDGGSFAAALGIEMVPIPVGEFGMGAADSDDAALASEFPRHQVAITHPFRLSARLVTVGQFRKFVEQTEYQTEAEAGQAGGFAYDFQKDELIHDSRLNWRHPGYSAPYTENDPVVQVSWNDAVAFTDWLSREDKKPYRLPTEAEWEYGCRAGCQESWSFGSNSSNLGEFAWIRENSPDGPKPVGLKKPNRFRLFDMHGNVWEWCLDRFGPYSANFAIDPQGPGRGIRRVLRGGSWDWDAREGTRSSARLDADPHRCYFGYGFRVCLPQ